MALSTPVAFFIFNRPELTRIVFDTIRKAQPCQLFVIADGPRTRDEQQRCQATREIVKQVDWPCEVFLNYADANLGCKARISSGITWVFEHVEEAIILEDDCAPIPSFFPFCQSLLEQYREDQRIFVINGSNFQNGIHRTSYSYYFSRYNHCWGWATWKRAWQHWHSDREKWTSFKDQGLMEQLLEDPEEREHWMRVFDKLFLEGRPNTWDYPWMFACWSQGRLAITPVENMVSNLGFGELATHTKEIDPRVAYRETRDIWDISHPPFVVRHREADVFTFRNAFKEPKPSLLRKVLGFRNYIGSGLIYRARLLFTALRAIRFSSRHRRKAPSHSPTENSKGDENGKPY